MQEYQFGTIRDLYNELLATAKTGFENHHLRRLGGGCRSFCIIEDGDMDGQEGHWVEDDETLEVGFIAEEFSLEADDSFWLYDEESCNWINKRFRGRALRRGQPKGKGRGHGAKGKSQFRSRGRRKKGPSGL